MTSPPLNAERKIIALLEQLHRIAMREGSLDPLIMETQNIEDLEGLVSQLQDARFKFYTIKDRILDVVRGIPKEPVVITSRTGASPDQGGQNV